MGTFTTAALQLATGTASATSTVQVVIPAVAGTPVDSQASKAQPDSDASQATSLNVDGDATNS